MWQNIVTRNATAAVPNPGKSHGEPNPVSHIKRQLNKDHKKMTNSPHLPKKQNEIRSPGAAHRFTIGQIVRMKSRHPGRTVTPSDTFHITALLPFASEMPQYRIRSEQELHERVTTQDRLELITVSEKARDNALLIAKTFGV
ncbi:hypothetical protein [Roseibium sp.]|uniref:hypothetical protein n=1 Tax=Roseibium sp. TaxID=1936156 RepID=UPI003D11D038